MKHSFYLAVAVILIISLFVAAPQYATAAGGACPNCGYEKEVSLNPMEIMSNTGVWTAIVFATVFVILYIFAFGPIAKALDEREQGILDNIASAQKRNDDAKGLLTQYQEKLDAAKDEVRQILEKAKKDAERQADDIIAKAREAAGLERDRAMKEIESATTSALQSIAEQSATLATNLAGRMIRAEVRPDQHRNLIDAALRDFTTRS